MTKAPSVKVGDKFKTNRSGFAEVIEYTNSKNIRIRFVDTGNEKKCRADNLLNGNVLDDVEYKLADVSVGTIHPTTNHGDVQVLEYKRYKEIRVVFLQTGKEKWTNGCHLRLGYIAPNPD